MKTLWIKENKEDSVATVQDGCTLSEDETKILIKLAGNLSMEFLYSKGFSKEDAIIIAHWSAGI